MANTICLSTDMSTLHLITPEGAVSSFTLSGNGVDLSLSNGEVTAASATKPPSGNQDTFTKTNKQYTVFFDDMQKTLEFIGWDEQEINRTSFSLNGGVNIKSTSNDIILTS